jgi:hypothetical protein
MNEKAVYKVPYWISKLEEIIDYAKQKSIKDNYQMIDKYRTHKM